MNAAKLSHTSARKAEIRPILCLLWVVVWILSGPRLCAGEARIAVLGDSITYDGRWVTLVESALRRTPQFRDAEVVNLGLPSETVSGLSEEGHAGGRFVRPCLEERLGRVLAAFKPTLVLACYGMNDGIYLPLDEVRFRAYREGMTRVKDAVERAGAEIIIITPPLYKADKPSEDVNHYDAVLDAYGNWLVGRRADGWRVVDIRPELKAAVALAKAADTKFSFASDGVHPGAEGHRFIAESVYRQLWPVLVPGAAPRFAEGAALEILSRRAELLKLAWLSKTGHKRPEIPAGRPMEEARVQAAKLLLYWNAVNEARISEWNGYERVDLILGGHAALLIRPKSPAAGKPWIWRTEFFGHEPQADVALLGRGWHVAYVDVQNLYGAPPAMRRMDDYYDFLTQSYGLSEKAVLEGFSRGGLFAFNWAALHPGRTAGLYVDAPVCDFKSWPGGKGVGPGSLSDWESLLKVYGFTEAQALAYDKNPVDNLAPLAKGKIPILAVIGDADEVVPVSENIDVVEKRYRALGGNIQVIRKPGVKHHPHSLPDPKPIIEFVLKTCGPH
jgi:pimeloyl-ACP methyl ester carboxylesterase/lysophospholipase L1-like esterase